MTIAPTALDTVDTPSGPIGAELLRTPGRVARRAEVVGLSALVAGAAGLRLPTIGRGYWVDEGISVGIASHRLASIPSLLRVDGSPPLFYLLLHVWIRLVGTSQAATHTLTLLLSVALVPVAWWSARQLLGRAAAWGAAGLVAVSPFLVWFSTETRMYPLVALLAMAAVTFAVRADTTGSRRDAAFAVVSFVALLYTHNWGVYLLGATACTLAGRAMARGDRRRVAAVAAATGAVGVAYAPWLPTLLFQVRHTAAPWAVRPALTDLFSDPASTIAGTASALVVPVLIVSALALTRTRDRQVNATVVTLAVIGCLTDLAGWMAAQVKPSWASRYLAVGVSPLILAIAGALATTSTGRRVLAASCAVLGAWGVAGTLMPAANQRYAKSNVEAVAAAVHAVMHPGDVVIVTQTEQLAVVTHYLPPGLRYATPVGAAADPRVVDWRDLTARLTWAFPCSTLAPLVDTLPLGGHVLVVNPLYPVGAPGSPWSRVVNTEAEQVDEYVATDPGLGYVADIRVATKPVPYSGVSAELYVKQSGLTGCAAGTTTGALRISR